MFDVGILAPYYNRSNLLHSILATLLPCGHLLLCWCQSQSHLRAAIVILRPRTRHTRLCVRGWMDGSTHGFTQP